MKKTQNNKLELDKDKKYILIDLDKFELEMKEMDKIKVAMKEFEERNLRNKNKRVLRTNPYQVAMIAYIVTDLIVHISKLF